jgi:hypothetical protein
MLDRRPDSKQVTNAYTRRVQLYRGEIGPDVVAPLKLDQCAARKVTHLTEVHSTLT